MNKYISNCKGEVFSWGFNLKGQLGQGICQNLSTPTFVETLRPQELLRVKSLPNIIVKSKNAQRSQSSEKISQNQTNIKRSESIDRLINGMEKVAFENNIDIIKTTHLSNTSKQSQLNEDEFVVQIACGTLHTLILTCNANLHQNIKQLNFKLLILAQARVFSTGFGESYALGHGNNISINQFMEISCFTIQSQNRAQNKIKDLSNSILSDDEYVEFVSCGLVHSVCLTNKRILAWGMISEDISSVYQYPQDIFLEDINYSKDIQQQKIVDIQCGHSQTLLLTKGGNIYGLGKQPVESSQTKQKIPVHIARRVKNIPQISKIAVNGTHCLAYSKESKKVYGFGSNSFGQLLLNSMEKQISSPEEIAILKKDCQNILLACGPTNSIIITDQQCQINKLSIPQKQVVKNMNEIPSKQEQQPDIQIIKSELDKQRLSLIQKNNDLQKQIEEMTNENYVLSQEEEKSINDIGKLKQQLTKYEKELTTYQKQSSMINNNNDKNVKFKISNSEKFKNVISRTFTPNIEVNYEDLEIQNKITEGGYGIIYKAKWREIVVAVKKFKLDYNNPQQIAEFITECNAMEALRHPNIVLFLGACTQAPNFSIVMEYCQRGSLWSLLQNKDVPLQWEDRRKISLDIAKAVFFLHSAKPPIVHRDLKSLNILVDDNFRCKLTDFGWTRVKPQDNYMTNKIVKNLNQIKKGTYQWMAPEVVKGFYYTEKADVFSYSIILWEIAAREPPYRGIKGELVAQDVFSKNLRPVIPQNTPKQFKNLIEQCWDAEPDKRPSFKEIIKLLDMLVIDQKE